MHAEIFFVYTHTVLQLKMPLECGVFISEGIVYKLQRSWDLKMCISEVLLVGT